MTKLVRKTRQATRELHGPCGRTASAEEIRMVMEGIRGDDPVSTIRRREGIHTNLYYRWLKESTEAGKARLKGAEQRGATRSEVQEFQRESERLKQLVAELSLANMVSTRSLI